MAIKVKAIERNVAFEKGAEKWAYVLQADLYSKLSQAKVIQEASLRSGIPKGSINAAWDAIGEVIKAWATEGHSVAVPGLGSMRFGIRSASVANVNKVGTDLITSRRVIFTPSLDIKNELKATSINITCYDRDGNIVKRVTSTDDSDVEDPEDDGNDPNGGGNTGGTQNSGNSGSQTSTTKYTVSVASNDPNMGTVSGGGEYAKDSQATLKATPKSGYLFDQWSDGNKNATRTINVTRNQTLVATFYPEGGTRPSEEENELPPAE